MTRFTAPRLPAYAALAGSGLIAGLALGRVEPIALAAPLVLALVAAVASNRPEVSVQLSLDRDRALEGEEVTATIELSASAGADRFDLLLRVPPDLQALDSTARAIRLHPGKERTIDVRLRCERWGAFALGPLLVQTHDVLGLRSWEGVAGERQMLRVYPTEETLHSLVPALETQVYAGNQVSRVRGEGIEFADLREWQPGDRIRRVNWRATALRGSLWVNEQHPERNPTSSSSSTRSQSSADRAEARTTGLCGPRQRSRTVTCSGKTESAWSASAGSSPGSFRSRAYGSSTPSSTRC